MIDRKNAIKTAKAVAINYNNLIDSAEREADELEREADKLEREVNKKKWNSPSSNSLEETFTALVLIGVSAALLLILDKIDKNN